MLTTTTEKCSWCGDDFEDGLKFDVDDGTHWCSGCKDKYESNCEPVTADPDPDE